MLIRACMISVVLLSFGSTAVLAQSHSRRATQPAPRQATQQEQDACEPDAKKLCKAVEQDGDMAVLACLQDNRKKLSKGCLGVLDSYGL
jgi:hypothetical protein